MKINNISLVSRLKASYGKKKVRYPRFPLLLFITTGIISTIWFLIRVIPKPTRATYPCMQAAAPFMSGFVVYLLSLGVFTLALRKVKQSLLKARYLAFVCFVLVALISLAFVLAHPFQVTYAVSTIKSGPDDGPNQPMGQGTGVNPGRVVWVWDPKATNASCINAFELYKPENTNQGVVCRMVVQGMKKLSSTVNLFESWDALFHNFNLRKNNVNRGYRQGEKIFIKINQGTANGKLKENDRKNGFYISEKITQSADAQKGKTGTCETYPNVVLEILRELVNVVGVEQKNIAIGDPIAHIYGHNYEVWAAEFPEVVYVDKISTDYGRTLIKPTAKELIYYSDKTQGDKLYDVIENADYMINVANLKPHGRAGMSLTAKNHFGSHARSSAFHLHSSLISPVSLGNPSNAGYGKYRVMVDLMGSRYLGKNTLLFVVDGLYGGGSNETRVPVKYYMPPFNDDWCNSVFLSQDQVAIESVCYDFLRSEWNGTFKHNAFNSDYETIPNVNGVDDYLHQAADPVNWPKGIVYDPDNSGKPLESLGVHEHWNNAQKKQYSRNLGLNKGIELVAIPDTLLGKEQQPVMNMPGEKVSKTIEAAKEITQVDAEKPSKRAVKVSFTKTFFDPEINADRFYSVTVDDHNIKWFLTDKGIISYDGHKWSVHTMNRKIPGQGLRQLFYEESEFGQEIWIAGAKGATVASLPVDAKSGATTYYKENSSIASENVLALTVGKGSLRWFGTDKGISAFRNSDWLANAYERKYPESLFTDFPITAMSTSPDGDSLYVATEGAGVARVYRDKVDAISGASEYAQWGPIEIPSDKVYSICVTPDGTQWFGTDKGVARHIGHKTLENWTVYTMNDGLADNFVQAIASDKEGNMWFGTKAGVSVFWDPSWSTYTVKEGLPSNNILCIITDKEGTVWMGTDKGVISFKEDKFTCYHGN